MAERGDAGHSCCPVFLFEAFGESGSPHINRFLSADTIVPNPTNPQSMDRYSYLTNNPLRYSDPSGHRACGDDEATDCETGLLNHPSNHGNKGCGGTKPHCLGKTKQVKGLIQEEIDRRFNAFTGWLPADFDYASSEYPTYDYYAEQAYEHAGYDLHAIAASNQENPMTEQDWVNSDVDIDYIYSKGVRGQPPGHKFFLNYMGRDVNNPSNYETNYLNTLQETHAADFQEAKKLYFNQLLTQYGTLEGAWAYLQMNIGVNGPD